jgi:hypothetical protein
MDPRLLMKRFNRKVMLDLAYRAVFGRKIEHQTRAVLDMVIQTALEDRRGMVTTTALADNVASVNDVSPQTARKQIDRACELNLIIRFDDEDLRTRKLYWFAEGVEDKLGMIDEVSSQIERVLQIQLSDPFNPNAGRDLFGIDGIYFNYPFDAPSVRKGVLKNAA